MKLRKIKVTEKNIYALAGRIEKFFESVNEEGGWEYDCDKKGKMINNTHYFNAAGCICIESRIAGYSDGSINHDEKYDKYIAMCNLLPHKILIGDIVYLNGNHFMYQQESGRYRMHERVIPPKYDIRLYPLEEDYRIVNMEYDEQPLFNN